MALSVWSAFFPTREAKEKYLTKKAKKAMEDEDDSLVSQREKLWELRNMPPTPGFQPFTPRTTAFNTLNRQLPLRQ